MIRILFALALAVQLPAGRTPLPGPKMTVKLVVNGPGLRDNVEITDPPAIAANIYGGNFMTTATTEPDKTWPRYRIVFYLNKGGRGVVAAYAVVYVRNPKTGEGFVYLPGRGDADYRLNISSIIRDGSASPGLQPARDGQWQCAETSWSAAVNAQLPRL